MTFEALQSAGDQSTSHDGDADRRNFGGPSNPGCFGFHYEAMLGRDSFHNLDVSISHQY
jgi:hypothetical protein